VASTERQLTLPAAVLQQTPNLQLEILRAEEGQYVDGVWQTTRILNGDQTDRGLNFRGSNPTLVRIRLHTLPSTTKPYTAMPIRCSQLIAAHASIICSVVTLAGGKLWVSLPALGVAAAIGEGWTASGWAKSLCAWTSSSAST